VSYLQNIILIKLEIKLLVKHLKLNNKGIIMRSFIGLIIGLLATFNSVANDPADITTWGDMTGKVRNVNVSDFPYTVKDGIGSVKYVGAKGADIFGAPGVTFDAKPYRGKRLKFSAKIKTKDSKSSSLWMRVDDLEAKRMIAFDNGEARSKAGTNNWVDFSVILPVDAKATRIAAGLLHLAQGEMSVKDAIFEVTDEESTASYIYGNDVFAKNPTDVTTWGDMTGKVGGVNISDFPYTVKDGIGTVKFAGKEVADIFGAPGVIFDAKPYRGKLLKLTAKIKTENSQGSSLWMRVDENAKMLAFDNGEARSKKGTNDWVDFSVVLPIDEKATSILAGLLQLPKGEMSVKDVILEVTNEESTASFVDK
jgi:hypothetical protein